MARTVAQLESELVIVRQSITDSLQAGQSYSKPGLSFNRVQFDALIKREKQLELQISRMSNGGAIILSDFSHETVEGV
jgi:hypothetical protein